MISDLCISNASCSFFSPVQYFQKKGTLVLDARDFKQALLCVPGSYNVPARVFKEHLKIFPTNRNYFIYGTRAEVSLVASLLGSIGAKDLFGIESSNFRQEWQWEAQEKLPPYYIPINVDEMYGRYVDGDPQDRDPILVDVRGPVEYAKSHIKYAINVPMAELKKNFDVLPVTQKVYLYGQDSLEGYAAAKIFADEYRAYTMPIVGGLDAWVAKGYPTAGGAVAGGVVTPFTEILAMLNRGN